MLWRLFLYYRYKFLSIMLSRFSVSLFFNFFFNLDVRLVAHRPIGYLCSDRSWRHSTKTISLRRMTSGRGMRVHRLVVKD